jgi:hypothetical protein
MLSVFRWRPFVFELRDLYPESLVTVGILQVGPLLRLLEGLELYLYRRAVAVVAVTEAFRENLIRRGIPGDKILVVTNGIDLTRFRPLARDAALAGELGLAERPGHEALRPLGTAGQWGAGRPFVAGYVGTHGMAHALETVLEAARLLQDPASLPASLRATLPAAPSALPPIHFILLGDGSEKPALKAKAAALSLANMHFLDTVPKAEVPRYWSLLDVAIIHLRRKQEFAKVIPSKLFECMGMGIPVLHGVAGESAEIIEREGMGLLFEAENAEALCDGLLRLAWDRDLYHRLRTNALAAAPHYDRIALARKMLGVLEAVAGP